MGSASWPFPPSHTYHIAVYLPLPLSLPLFLPVLSSSYPPHALPLPPSTTCLPHIWTPFVPLHACLPGLPLPCLLRLDFPTLPSSPTSSACLWICPHFTQTAVPGMQLEDVCACPSCPCSPLAHFAYTPSQTPSPALPLTCLPAPTSIILFPAFATTPRLYICGLAHTFTWFQDTTLPRCAYLPAFILPFLVFVYTYHTFLPPCFVPATAHLCVACHTHTGYNMPTCTVPAFPTACQPAPAALPCRPDPYRLYLYIAT